jgi:hypothetical protein
VASSELLTDDANEDDGVSITSEANSGNGEELEWLETEGNLPRPFNPHRHLMASDSSDEDHI